MRSKSAFIGHRKPPSGNTDVHTALLKPQEVFLLLLSYYLRITISCGLSSAANIVHYAWYGLRDRYAAKSVATSNVVNDLCHPTPLRHRQPLTWLDFSRWLKVVGGAMADRGSHPVDVWTRHVVRHLELWSAMTGPSPGTATRSQPAGYHHSCWEPNEVTVTLEHRGLYHVETGRLSTCLGW